MTNTVHTKLYFPLQHGNMIVGTAPHPHDRSSSVGDLSLSLSLSLSPSPWGRSCFRSWAGWSRTRRAHQPWQLPVNMSNGDGWEHVRQGNHHQNMRASQSVTFPRTHTNYTARHVHVKGRYERLHRAGQQCTQRGGPRGMMALTVVPHLSVVLPGAKRLHRGSARGLCDTAGDGGAGGDERACARARGDENGGGGELHGVMGLM